MPSFANDTAMTSLQHHIENDSETTDGHHIATFMVPAGIAVFLVIVVTIMVIIVCLCKTRRNSKKTEKRSVRIPQKPTATTVPVCVTPQRRNLFPRSWSGNGIVSHFPLLPTDDLGSQASSPDTSDSEEYTQFGYTSSTPSSRSPSIRSNTGMARREKGRTDLRGSTSYSAPSSPRLFKSSPLVPTFHRSPYGRVKFIASYSANDSTLEVKIVCAGGLPELIAGKGCNSFVKVYLAPDEDYHERRTQTVKHNRSPQFDTTFTFKGMAIEDVIQRTLVMHVCHQSDHGMGITHKNSLIGVASVNLNTIQEEMQTKEPTWIYLTNGDMDLFQNIELEITLCLLPETNLLTVIVNKVINIPNKDATAVYVSYRVRCNQRTIFKVRTTKYSSTRPVYHYQKSFNISSYKAEDIELHFKVKTRKGFGQSKTIGRAIVGARAPSASGRDHWTETMNCHEQVARYHKVNLLQERDCLSPQLECID